MTRQDRCVYLRLLYYTMCFLFVCLRMSGELVDIDPSCGRMQPLTAERFESPRLTDGTRITAALQLASVQTNYEETA